MSPPRSRGGGGFADRSRRSRSLRRRPGEPGRHARWLLVATLGACIAAALPATRAAADDAWSPPVPGAVVRGYLEPLAQFASGHRGVDFAAAPSSPVRAANDGRVTFAGDVSGSLHVVIEHAGGIRTSYSFLARIDVANGDSVRRGTVIGVAGGDEGNHRAGVLHFGARAGSSYFDPMLLFGPTDLTEIVRLVPAEPLTASDVQLIFQEFDDDCGLVQLVCDIGEAIGDGAGWTWDRVEDAIDLAIVALATVAEVTQELIDRVDRIVRDVLQTLRDVAADVIGAIEELAGRIEKGVVELFQTVVEAGLALYEALTSCPQPPSVARPKGSGNFVVAVGGLMSSIKQRPRPKHGDEYKESFQTRWGRLGYAHDDVEHFSYDPSSTTYTADDTLSDLHEQARSLGTQIKAAALEHPGVAVDLAGHSMGGVVIDLFLTEVYRGHENEYPPIENVTTFASPHEGTPLADLEDSVNDHLILGPLVRTIDPTDVIGAESVDQMTTDSDTIEHLWDHGGIPPGIRYMSIIGSEDPVVPSHRADVPGATKVVVPAGGSFWPDDHAAVLRDDDAISAAQAHLSGRAPADSCGLFTDFGGWVYEQLLDKASSKVSETPGGTAYVDKIVKEFAS